MITSKQQLGFAPLIAILIVIVLVVAGGVGYYSYTSYKAYQEIKKPEIEEAKCLKEGETYMPGEDKQCCADLEAMTITYGDGVICTLPMGYICIAFCGDGKCEGEYENACSCPEDCKEVKCLGLGKEVNPSLPPEYSNLGKECCQELKLIPVKQWFDENCNRQLIVGAGSVCATCGNGVCDEKYENTCNCPEDCLPKAASITVTSPNGGEKWVVGNAYDITWQSTGVDRVKIYLGNFDSGIECVSQCLPPWGYGKVCCNPCGYQLIATDISASLSKYSWTIFITQAAISKAKVAIQSTSVNGCPLDYGDNYFSIVE